MVPVVADEPVGDRRLRRGRLERGVGVDHAGGGVEAGIGDAPHADLAVVVGHVLDQPVDGVVGVACSRRCRWGRFLSAGAAAC